MKRTTPLNIAIANITLLVGNVIDGYPQIQLRYDQIFDDILPIVTSELSYLNWEGDTSNGVADDLCHGILKSRYHGDKLTTTQVGSALSSAMQAMAL
jgi:hypothetical protein